MSKQLTLSATAAILAMASFAFAAGLGGLAGDPAGRIAATGPLAELHATR